MVSLLQKLKRRLKVRRIFKGFTQRKSKMNPVVIRRFCIVIELFHLKNVGFRPIILLDVGQKAMGGRICRVNPQNLLITHNRGVKIAIFQLRAAKIQMRINIIRFEFKSRLIILEGQIGLFAF